MNYINFLLICFQIWCIIKYIKKLKDTDERLQQNEIDYFELKAQNAKLECYLKDLSDNNAALKNKIIILENEIKKD